MFAVLFLIYTCIHLFIVFTIVLFISVLTYTAVRDTLKDASFKSYRPHVVQTQNQGDYGKGVTFVVWALNKIKHSPDFVKLLLFSDVAIFHLKGSMDRKKSSLWVKENPNWTVDKISKQSPCDDVGSSRLL